MIDSSVDPRSLFRDLSEQSKLITGTGGLALQPGDWERGLLCSPFYNVSGNGFDARRDLPQECAAFTSGCPAVDFESIRRELHGAIDFLRSRGNEAWLQLLTGGGITGVQ